MRTTKLRRTLKRERLATGLGIDLEALAGTVSYVLTPEHKDYLTAAGPGKLRSDASACPRDLDFDDVVEWLRNAVRARHVSADLNGDFPRYAWARVEGRVYKARLCNAGFGGHKVYPLRDHDAAN